MFKTIDFYEIEQNPRIIDDVFQQLIGQIVEFRLIGISSVSIFDRLIDYIFYPESRLIVFLFKDSENCFVDYSLDGQIEIDFDIFLSIITVCYKKV